MKSSPRSRVATKPRKQVKEPDRRPGFTLKWSPDEVRRFKREAERRKMSFSSWARMAARQAMGGPRGETVLARKMRKQIEKRCAGRTLTPEQQAQLEVWKVRMLGEVERFSGHVPARTLNVFLTAVARIRDEGSGSAKGDVVSQPVEESYEARLERREQERKAQQEALVRKTQREERAARRKKPPRSAVPQVEETGSDSAGTIAPDASTLKGMPQPETVPEPVWDGPQPTTYDRTFAPAMEKFRDKNPKYREYEAKLAAYRKAHPATTPPPLVPRGRRGSSGSWRTPDSGLVTRKEQEQS